MPVTVRGNNFQATVNWNGERYRKSFQEREAAEIWILESKAGLLKGKQPELIRKYTMSDRPQTVGEMADYTLRHHWAGMKSEDKLSLNANAVVEALGSNTLLSAVDAVAIDNAKLLWKQKGNSNSTLNRKLAALSKILSFAEERGFIQKRPKIGKYKEPGSRIRWFSDEEKTRMEKMLRHLGHADHWGIVRVLLDTGMRTGELFRLEAGDLEGNLIVLVETKNSSPRSIPMTAATSAIIRGNIAKHGTPFGWTNYEKFKRIWDQMRLHLGWDKDIQAVPYACRHTFISNLVQVGTPIAMVRELAGHKTIQMTLRYTHLSPSNLEDAMKRFEKETASVGSLPTPIVA